MQRVEPDETKKKLAAVEKIQSSVGEKTEADKKFLFSSHGYASQLKMNLFHASTAGALGMSSFQAVRASLTGATDPVLGGLAIAALILWHGLNTVNYGIAPIDDVCDESKKRMDLHKRQSNTLYLYPWKREADHSISATRTDGALIGAALAVLSSADNYRVIEVFAAIILLHRLSVLWGAAADSFGATTKYEMRK